MHTMFGRRETQLQKPSHEGEPIVRRRQVTAMAVAGVIVIAGLVGMSARPRVAAWPLAVDGECRDRVAAGVDVNRDDWPALAQLPGIGEGLARRIVAHREDRREASGTAWRFETAGELQSVSGIGPKTVRRIAPFVRVAETGQAPRPQSARR